MLSEALIEELLAFRRERDWEQFHNLRTLSTSIVLEAAELAEITQWAKDSELGEVMEEKRRRIEEEVADIAILLSYLLHDAGIGRVGDYLQHEPGGQLLGQQLGNGELLQVAQSRAHRPQGLPHEGPSQGRCVRL